MGIGKAYSAAEATLSVLGQGRPGSVTLAAGLQVLIAVTFLVMPILVYRRGGRCPGCGGGRGREAGVSG